MDLVMSFYIPTSDLGVWPDGWSLLPVKYLVFPPPVQASVWPLVTLLTA